MNKTIIDSITVYASGDVEVWLRKRPIDPSDERDGVRGGHRFTLAAGDDVSGALLAEDRLLRDAGVCEINSESRKRLTALCAAAWTDEVVAAFKEQSQQHNQ